MIKVRSTYNVSCPLDVGGVPLDSYTLDIYIWSGDYAAKPTVAEFTLTNINQENKIGFENVNISTLLKDYINISLATLGSTEVLDSTNTMWCEVIHNDTTTLLSDVFTFGYGYALDGLNATTPTNKILLQGDEYRVSRTSTFILPIESADNDVEILSYPNSEINVTETITQSDNSNTKVKNVVINVADTITDEYIAITYNGVTTIIYIYDEYKYTPLDIHFINKEGFQQVLTFFKERKDSTNVNKETYQKTGINIVNGEHQFKDYNVNSKSSFKMNSGFIEEENNEAFKQMLLSEYVWVYDNGYIPVNIDTTTLEYKNRINDRLIKYNIDFSYSFNDITNV